MSTRPSVSSGKYSDEKIDTDRIQVERGRKGSMLVEDNKCIICGQKVEIEDKFCRNCGVKLLKHGMWMHER